METTNNQEKNDFFETAKQYFRVGDNYFEFVNVPNVYGKPVKEFHKFEEKAKKAGVSKAVFLHDAGLNAIVVARMTPQEMAEIRELANLKNGIGSILNQLAKSANTFGYSTEIHEQLKNLLLNLQKNDR